MPILCQGQVIHSHLTSARAARVGHLTVSVMEDIFRGMQPRLRLAGGFETILQSHPIRGEPGIHFSALYNLIMGSRSPPLGGAALAARFLWEFYDLVAPVLWEFPEFAYRRGFVFFDIDAWRTPTPDSDFDLSISIRLMRDNQEDAGSDEEDDLEERIRLCLLQRNGGQLPVCFNDAFVSLSLERFNTMRWSAYEERRQEAYETARRGGLASVKNDISQKVASIECVRAAVRAWERYEEFSSEFAPLRKELATYVEEIEAAAPTEFPRYKKRREVFRRHFRRVAISGTKTWKHFPSRDSKGLRMTVAAGNEFINYHGTEACLADVDLPSDFNGDEGGHNTFNIRARVLWEYAFLLELFFEKRPEFAGPDGRVRERASFVGPHFAGSLEFADAPFVETFVNLMVYQVTEERETSPEDYARMIDEQYMSTYDEDLVLVGPEIFGNSLVLKEKAIETMRKHVAAWEAVEIPLQCRLAFLLCLQRCRREPFVPPRTGFLGRLVARVKRARLPEDEPGQVLFKIANAPPDIIRNIAEYV